MASVSADLAVAQIQSGQRILVHGAAAAPALLLAALARRASSLRSVKLIHLHLEGGAPHVAPELHQSFRAEALFVGANLRAAVNDHRADYIPVFLSEVESLFQAGRRPIDVALLHLSRPDKHGYCSFGTSVDVAKTAALSAKIRIAQLNRRMPRTLGDGFIHISQLDAAVECDEALPQVLPPKADEVSKAIGRHVAALIEDGATLQMGIGGIPNAVLAALGNHRRLGVHTEMFSDGLLPLIQAGVVTGENKKRQRGKVVSSFVVGSQAIYDFIDDNPLVELRASVDVNDPTHIAQQPQMTAINSALEVDLTGQVCADSLGQSIYSGVGGQMDFIRGASLSPGGKAIIALPSKTHAGASRIVTLLKPGAGVVTTRAHVHWIVTEFGSANLFGLPLEERKQALAALAAPEHRDALLRSS